MAELAAVREPEWLKERRSDAARRAAELDLPRFKGKAGWEFTDISKLDLAAFTAAVPGEGDASAVDRVETLLEAPEGAHHLGQVDGRVIDGGDAPDDLLVLPLTLACETHADLVEEHFGKVVDAEQDVFTALNDAGWTGGAFVYVPRDVRVEQPIVLTAISDAAGTALHRRVLIVVEEGAEAEVWEQHLSGSTDAETMLTSIVELRVGQNATPALRRRPGPQREVVGVRLPARRGRARRAPGLGHGGLRLRQRQGVHGDAAGRRGLARQGHRRLRPARAPARGLPHAAGARRGEHDVGPRVPGHPGRSLERRLARHDQGRPGRPADRRLPGVPQPAALQEGARGRDPGPRDPRQRRALHARGGDRPDRPGAGLLPALARARTTRSPSAS